jgi:hypothetical protein
MAAAALLGGAVLAAAAPAAQAQPMPGPNTINVPCSSAALIAAIHTANGLGPSTLRLQPHCTYNITTPATASDGLPVITGDITLAGRTGTQIRRSPAAVLSYRIVEVAGGGRLTARDVTITNGRTAAAGGAILNSGRLTLDQVRLTGNRAGNGGALGNNAGATATADYTEVTGNTTTSVGGGGVINSGTLTLLNSLLSGNTAPVNGGGVNTQPSGVTHLSRTTITRNTSGSLGGGVANLGTTTMFHTLVQFNRGSAGGGVATGNSHVTLVNSFVTDNTPDNCSPLNTISGCVN